MEKWEKHALSFAMNLLLIMSAFVLGKEMAKYTQGNQICTRVEPKYNVVIDAGHGGMDPGKVGIDGTLEKDINLLIAKKLKIFLEQSDVRIIMTRETDCGLYDDKKPNKKVQDMKNRLELMNQSMPDLVVSIHQNSYGQENVSGAQIFYYGTSQEGKKAAQTAQQQLQSGFPDLYPREAKPNESYYLLKKSSVPLIIVECGFLSNRLESEKLKNPIYQEKMAWNLHLAVLRYLNEKE